MRTEGDSLAGAATSRGVPGARRRTQRERREATVAKLLDATIATVSELGYARASIQEICRRAGVSHGGLFRHFTGRLDLVIAAADEVHRRQLHTITTGIASLPADAGVADAGLRLLRDAALDPLNAVWHELVIAGRTDQELNAGLAPLVRKLQAAWTEAAHRAPCAQHLPPDVREALAHVLVQMFEGEAMTRPVHDRADLVERKFEIVKLLMAAVTHGHTPEL